MRYEDMLIDIRKMDPFVDPKRVLSTVNKVLEQGHIERIRGRYRLASSERKSEVRVSKRPRSKKLVRVLSKKMFSLPVGWTAKAPSVGGLFYVDSSQTVGAQIAISFS